ncbi:MAG: protocatechuate 3,4-dioxygenase subunit alpha [Pseudomonadota bacterium]
MSANFKHRQTPSQTVGPYFAYGLTPSQYDYGELSSLANPQIASEGAGGQHIRIFGHVLDGNGAVVSDAMIELWQADAHGRYASGGRGFFGRCGTGTDGENRFWFNTVKPGSVGGAAPHASLIVFLRGLLTHVYTRVYFSDEAVANGKDPVLLSVPEQRRKTLIAERIDGPGGPAYRFDIHMQGEKETVFFDV